MSHRGPSMGLGGLTAGNAYVRYEKRIGGSWDGLTRLGDRSPRTGRRLRQRTWNATSSIAQSHSDVGGADAETGVTDEAGGVDAEVPDATLEGWAARAGDTQISAAWVTQQFDALKDADGMVRGSTASVWSGVMTYLDERTERNLGRSSSVVGEESESLVEAGVGNYSTSRVTIFRNLCPITHTS